MMCELYRVSDTGIDCFLEDPKKAIDFIDNEYASVYGRLHNDNTVFSMDKAWDIALYLFRCADDTPEKLMNEIFSFQLYATEMVYYLKSEKVTLYNTFFKRTDTENLALFLDKESMMQQDVYRGGWLGNDHWEYIKEHLDTFKKAFNTAAIHNDGLVIAIN